ncbi:hypothetical protein TC41_3230 [Alicyclobacillus acidocaldarius subsp. acidocaldarius Tc-4-1]|uniref:Uncharacterized protein n=1 Tax=Alicyclobacillus acidocaldarius (strain Tc-4-1) TaxID=1048834 RepID=F8IDR6_ALIAT|nr:hypothetical protein TC41_3230 [Alicyclobacillus acidocaldarius subsp. acidocaldarius Tc-4-1]
MARMPASMGPPTISADQRLSCGFRGHRGGASMGPPTISADQLKCIIQIVQHSMSFNGAADDLGGSTTSRGGNSKAFYLLQWGRRRSRRINTAALRACLHPMSFNGAADDLGGSTSSPWQAPWPRRPFNGAADDLGGSTELAGDDERDVHIPSMGPPTISADQHDTVCRSCARSWPFNGAADDLGGSTCHTIAHISHCRVLQWGRRRSRRINCQPSILSLDAKEPSMGPPTISADQPVKTAFITRAPFSAFNGAADDLGGSTLILKRAGAR